MMQDFIHSVRRTICAIPNAQTRPSALFASALASVVLGYYSWLVAPGCDPKNFMLRSKAARSLDSSLVRKAATVIVPSVHVVTPVKTKPFNAPLRMSTVTPTECGRDLGLFQALPGRPSALGSRVAPRRAPVAGTPAKRAGCGRPPGWREPKHQAIHQADS